MVEFFNFDMSELKRDITTLVKTESDRIQKESEDKVKEIRNNFQRILTLKDDHVVISQQHSFT